MFELIDALAVDAAAGQARARAVVAADHAFLVDHFPGAVILPGSLQIELCAQLAGALAEEVTLLAHGVARWSFLGAVRNALFVAPVALPATVMIAAEVRRVEAAAVVVAASLSLAAGVPVCRAEVIMMMRDPEPAWAAGARIHQERIARWKARF